MAVKLGTTRDELRRTKDRSKIMNTIIRNAKSARPAKRNTTYTDGLGGGTTTVDEGTE
jgi:hypothetical protein